MNLALLESFDKITDFVRGNVTVISIIPESRSLHSGETSFRKYDALCMTDNVYRESYGMSQSRN